MTDTFEAWNIKEIQTALNIIDHMTAQGKTVNDLRAYKDNYKTLKDIVLIKKDRPIRIRPQKACPACGKMMKLLAVPDNEQFKSKWLCGSGCGSCNNGCGYVEFNDLSIEEIIKQGESI